MDFTIHRSYAGLLARLILEEPELELTNIEENHTKRSFCYMDLWTVEGRRDQVLKLYAKYKAQEYHVERN